MCVCVCVCVCACACMCKSGWFVSYALMSASILRHSGNSTFKRILTMYYLVMQSRERLMCVKFVFTLMQLISRIGAPAGYIILALIFLFEKLII